MTVRLRDLAACFEGVIPSILATAAPDGTPNIAYLSHVALAGDAHVALSNQFFSKTAANIRANPAAALLLVDPRDGSQYRLQVRFDHALDHGPLFEEMAAQLRASSAQIGMADVMRLRGIDIYRVDRIEPVPAPDPPAPAPAAHAGPPLAPLAGLARRIAGESELGAIIDAALDGLRDDLGFGHIMLLLKDPAAERLVAIGSRGYPQSGVGAEVPLGHGVIGTAAAGRRPVRVSDMSRLRRFGQAVQASAAEENRTRSIALPGMADAMSQLALPMVAQNSLRGVLFLESASRLAFTRDDEVALGLLAAHLAAALALAERDADDGQAARTVPDQPHPPMGRPFDVVHHAFDDSVFIDHAYLIKGVPGRLLVHLLGLHLQEGRTEFSNREIRLSDALRLPELKDNLETRLLLLRRRLEEKAAPVRLVRTGRGRIRLELAGPPRLATVGRQA
jgi:adenylate cyclase